MRKNLIWHKSTFSPPKSEKIFETLPNSLAKMASLWPNSIAILCDGKKYSFDDLACRAAGLASEINEAANTPGPIALIQSVGFDAIAAWFACSIAGRPFVLLEPDQPPARLIEIIDNAGCALVLGDHTTTQSLLNLLKVNLLISDGRKAPLLQDKGLFAYEPTMIFPTSGSTGDPKLITYSATTLLVKVQSSIQLMQVPVGARVLIAGSHGNYGFLHHALVFLLAGGAVCLTDVKAGGFTAVLKAINYLGARHIRFTPSMFRKIATLPQAHETLRLLDGVRFSGEPLLTNDLKLAVSVLKPGCLIQNVYGSTESALFIWSSSNDKAAATESTVPIGRIYPIASYAIQPIEDGDDSTGELLICSSFHALGDFKEGVINQERFPLLDDSSDERIYSTGDIVRRLPDGTLIHLGRSGRMVKVRGNRVFLTEVENHLRTFPGVTAAALVDRLEQDGAVLYGFITTNSTTITADNARIWLAAHLPDFMIPRSIETIAEIPLLPGGKVDYISLLTQIPTFYAGTNFETSEGGHSTRLTQLWDSILWVGAHKHDADFLALGGDSISLMMLSVEVERIFGKSIPLEEFRTKSTLRKLAEILDIEKVCLDVDKHERLQARLFLPSSQPSKGIALAMPSFGGRAQVFPFRQAGLFLDHDLWVADFSINKGNMLQSNRWWSATVEIVESIRDGAIPPPRVIFGFSFGGGLAWLVSRLLAGTPQCPKFVVMLDAPPLHHLKSVRNRALTRALDLVSHTQPPPSLHIRRAPLSNVGVGGGSINAWEPSDNIRMLVELPTVDHLEMVRWDMLALAAEAVTSFLDNKQSCNPWKPTLRAPEILGVQIHQAVNGNQTSLKKVMDELTKYPDTFSFDHLIALTFLMNLKKDDKKAKELISYIMKKWPDSRIVLYLNRRMRRNSNMLLSENIPSIYPLGIASFEISLAKSHNILDRPEPRPIRLLCLAFDVLCAILAAGWVRLKLKYSSIAELINRKLLLRF
jgi:acyl-CoA synthetase (AMP-forming)/AMP-acid ligase II/acyl carrier protein